MATVHEKRHISNMYFSESRLAGPTCPQSKDDNKRSHLLTTGIVTATGRAAGQNDNARGHPRPLGRGQTHARRPEDSISGWRRQRPQRLPAAALITSFSQEWVIKAYLRRKCARFPPSGPTSESHFLGGTFRGAWWTGLMRTPPTVEEVPDQAKAAPVYELGRPSVAYQQILSTHQVRARVVEAAGLLHKTDRRRWVPGRRHGFCPGSTHHRRNYCC